ncbi:hypothetical protein Drorol1_Dr00014352 [Drosera rotundifolia]
MTSELLLREFRGTVTQTTGCPKCGFVEVADMTFLSLSLDVEPYSALTARLKEFSSRVSITKKICKGCGRCIDFESKNKIKRAPRILILHLNRFQERQNGKLRKILHDVCFEHELELNG